LRVRACLLVRAHVRTLACTQSSASFSRPESLADVPSRNHPHTTTPTPVIAPSNTAMVAQAMVHRFPRPPSLRVVSCPVSRLPSASSRRAAILAPVHPSSPPLGRCPAEAPAGAGPGAAPRRGKGGEGGGGVFGLRRGRACVHMRGRRCTQAIRPSAWSGVECACVCEHGCLCWRMYALWHVRSRVPHSPSPMSHPEIIRIPPPQRLSSLPPTRRWLLRPRSIASHGHPASESYPVQS
jgi:hypothetical protein